jgi:hypothetical protein
MHLFVICTDVIDGNPHLMVSVSTIKAGVYHDPTCTIKAGEHPFIKHDSFVDYSKTRQMPTAGIAALVDGRVAPEKERCDERLLERVWNGIKTSAHSPRWAKDHFDKIERDRARRSKSPVAKAKPTKGVRP